MTKFKVLSAAVCLATALAATSPALARGGHGFRGGGVGAGLAAGLVAGAVVGGAYGYGGPGYYGDSYAYDNGYYGGNNGYYGNGAAAYPAYNRGYYNNDPNGFVCQPGTVFRGEDGRRHLCQ